MEHEAAKQKIREAASELPNLLAQIDEMPPEQRELWMAVAQLAFGRTVSVASNGAMRNLKGWTPDRWISVMTFLFVVIGGIWFAGGEWRGVKTDVGAVKEEIGTIRADHLNLHRKLDTLQREVREGVLSIEPADEYYRNTPRRGPQFER